MFYLSLTRLCFNLSLDPLLVPKMRQVRPTISIVDAGLLYDIQHSPDRLRWVVWTLKVRRIHLELFQHALQARHLLWRNCANQVSCKISNFNMHG